MTTRTDEQLLHRASAGVSELLKIYHQYQKGKVALVDGTDIDIPAEKIQAMKTRFDAVRDQVKADLDAIPQPKE